MAPRFAPTPLKDYVEEHGGAATGRQAGLTRACISIMLKQGRDIIVWPGRGNQIVLHEYKILKRRTG